MDETSLLDTESTETTQESKETSMETKADIESSASLLDDDAQVDATKPEETKEGETKAEEVPEFDLETVEIEGMNLDKNVLKEFKEAASQAGLKLSKEQAETLVKLQAKHIEGINARINEQVKEVHNQWKNDYIQDAIARGVDQKAELSLAKKALAQFGSAELTNDLKLSGLGNNKNIIQLLAKVGKLTSEDTMEIGRKAEKEKTLAERMF